MYMYIHHDIYEVYVYKTSILNLCMPIYCLYQWFAMYVIHLLPCRIEPKAQQQLLNSSDFEQQRLRQLSDRVQSDESKARHRQNGTGQGGPRPTWKAQNPEDLPRWKVGGSAEIWWIWARFLYDSPKLMDESAKIRWVAGKCWRNGGMMEIGGPRSPYPAVRSKATRTSAAAVSHRLQHLVDHQASSEPCEGQAGRHEGMSGDLGVCADDLSQLVNGWKMLIPPNNANGSWMVNIG